MTCRSCKSEAVKAGCHMTGVQCWKCQQCGKRLQDPQQKPLGTDVRLPREKACMILSCLVEGNSVRGTARLCNVEERTVLSLLTLADEACERLSERRVRNVRVADLECDEIVPGRKQKRLTPQRSRRAKGRRLQLHWLERTGKLVVAWHLGRRDHVNTKAFGFQDPLGHRVGLGSV